MFTSEPSLAQRIERMIGDTPIIDPSTRIRCDQPNAPDLAALMFDRTIETHLIAVGMPPTDLDTTLPPDERVCRSLPYLKKIRNTSTAWCLYRIFRDLYDFDEPHLTGSNYQGLFDRVLASGQDPDWARSVLQDRSKIVSVVTSLGNKSADASKNPDFFAYRLDADDVLFPFSREPSGYFARLETILGERPTTTEHLERLIFAWFDRMVTGRVKFTGAILPIEQRLLPPDEAHTQFVLNQASDDWDISEAEVGWLASFVAWSVMKWHHENKKVFQIAVGTESAVAHSSNVPRFRETWTSDMTRTFRHFSDARFSLTIESDLLNQDVAVLAGQLPNVFVSGDWGDNFVPSLIEKNVGLRVQVAPAVKVGGFLSNASYAEWSYGRLQVVRKAMAAALAKLVDARFFEEDEIPPLLRQILHDTPRDLYGLWAD